MAMDGSTRSKLTISVNDLKKHNTLTDCWIAIHSKVWDITDFIQEHPGGPESEHLRRPKTTSVLTSSTSPS